MIRTLQRLPILLLISGLTLLNGCCDKKNIPKFTQGLYSSTAKIRNESALQLARCGSDASAAVSRLSELLYDDNAGVQSSASYALREIDTPEAQRAIESAQKNRKRH